MVETLCFHCRGHRFNPRLGSEDPTCYAVQPKINTNSFKNHGKMHIIFILLTICKYNSARVKTFTILFPWPLSIPKMFHPSPHKSYPFNNNIHFQSSSSPWYPLLCFLPLCVPIQVPYINEIIQYLTFCVWLISLSIMLSKCTMLYYISKSHSF